MRRVFQPDEVERKLSKLQDNEHDGLRATYRRMLERGPQRFSVKPWGVPNMASLYHALPNFTEVLDDVKRHVALAQDSQDALEVTPTLLLGPPGIGKTHFAKKLADPLGALYSLLEHDTAQCFTDEFAEVAIDASQVIWVTTANDERNIPAPILNRMNVFAVEAPTLKAARQIAGTGRRLAGCAERHAPGGTCAAR